jgi:hypothetical protein
MEVLLEQMYMFIIIIEFNCVPYCNDQNDTFNKGPIDLYTLKVYNPKSYVYSPL